MITKNNNIACDECGRFIKMDDLIDGKAVHYMTNPDAYGSEETYESLCRSCYKPVDGEKK